MKVKIIILAAVSVVSYLAGQHIGNKVKKVEYIEVEKIQERVRTVTRIIERPDGSRETIIDERKETETDRKSQMKKVAQSDWSVGLTYGPSVFKQNEVYGLTVTRRVLGNLFIGAYGRTDHEVGLALRYEF
jgi:hypothetical protein